MTIFKPANLCLMYYNMFTKHCIIQTLLKTDQELISASFVVIGCIYLSPRLFTNILVRLIIRRSRWAKYSADF